MIKIPKKNIELATGYKVKKNFTSLGLDIATKSGYALVKSNCENITIECGYLAFDSSVEKELYRNMYNTFKGLISGEDLVVIENTHHQINPMVTIKLSRFGGMAIGLCIENKLPYQIIGATSSRSKLGINTKKAGKGKAKEAVADWLKNNLGIDLGLDLNDASDAIVLALLGILEGLDFRSQDAIKKDKK